MTRLKRGDTVMSGTNQSDCGTVLEVGDDVNGPVSVQWDTGEASTVGADCLNLYRDPDRLREDRDQ